ncbi:MAG: IS110 family transposase [Cytophagaceae bacterium]|nr:IS110 family transposase [Cytophagaceae bacterium]
MDGIGPLTATQIIITPNEFKDITQGKKFACYSGVAPFEHSSGSTSEENQESPGWRIKR